MKEVKKKSCDAATNAMLIKAMRSEIEVIWDRTEAMQPQCGFGRLSICCTECNDGPCRTNPFASDNQLTVCGRTQSESVSGHFLKKATDGAAAFASLAKEFQADIDGRTSQTVLLPADCMLAPADYTSRLSEIGQSTTKFLMSIRAAKEQVCEGKDGFAITTANLGSLKDDAVNIVLLGHVAPHIVSALINETSKSDVPFNFTGMCGGEINGNLPVLTNYQSQEMPLLTGAVDLLITGSQCVMPATISLARALNVPVAAGLSDRKRAEEVIQMAISAFLIRSRKKVNIPASIEKLYAGYTTANSRELLETLAGACSRGIAKGLVYIGGCGNVAKTQDESIINLAARLLAYGYVIVTAGCAGTALAKAGMCSPEYALRAGLESISEIGIPPVLHIGSCHDAGEFIKMAQSIRDHKIPVFAAMQELRHNKVLATAIAFASEGITTYIDWGEATFFPEIDLTGHVLPISDLEQLMQNSDKVEAS